MTPVLNTLALALVALALSGCGDAPAATTTPAESAAPARADWPIFRGDASLRGVAAGDLPSELGLRWSVETGDTIASSPVIADGRVYIGGDDGKVRALDLETGAEVWAFSASSSTS